MPIPTPATVKSQIAKRNLESSSTPVSGPSESSGRKKASKVIPSESKKSNSRTKKDNQRTSTSTTTSSSRSTKSSSRTTSSEVRSERKSTSTIKRKTGSTKPTQTTKPAEKKPFERPEHLTTRPLRNHEALLGLKKELEKPARGQFKRQYRVGGRMANKSAALSSKKENNN